MNKTLIVIAAVTCTLSIRCTKTEPNVFREFKPTSKNCQVQQVIQSYPFGLPDTMVFTYNKWGDPVSITMLPRPTTGAPNYEFRYDKKRRLTDIIGLYDTGTGAEFWEKYFYANPGNTDIISASGYTLVRLQNGVMVGYSSAYTTYYCYDKTGRIVKDSTIFDGHLPAWVSTYSYDAKGNIAGRDYDDKLNIHQTNRVWMFYDRDYSVNNPVKADAYNWVGLPTKITTDTKTGNYFRFIRSLQTLRSATVASNGWLNDSA